MNGNWHSKEILGCREKSYDFFGYLPGETEEKKNG